MWQVSFLFSSPLPPSTSARSRAKPRAPCLVHRGMFDISPADGAHPSGESKILPLGVAEKVLQTNRLAVDLHGRRVYVEWRPSWWRMAELVANEWHQVAGEITHPLVSVILSR